MRTMAVIAASCLLAALAYDAWFRFGAAHREGLDGAAGTAAFALEAVAALLFAQLARRAGRGEAPGRVAAGAAAAASASGLVLTLIVFPPAVTGSVSILAAVQGLGSAIVLGGSLAAMLLGHYYLVIPGLSLAPLRLLTRFLIAGAAAHGALGAAVWLAGGGERLWPEASASSGDPLAGVIEALAPLLVRVLFGLVGVLVLAIMAERTVAISSTRSATGILYAAVVFALLGEFASFHLLLISGVPL
jgi:hypothetical protein